MTEHIDAMKSAQVAIEAALEMHGPDHAGLLLGALAKIDRAIGASRVVAQCAPDQEALQAAWAEGYEFGLNSRDKTPGAAALRALVIEECAKVCEDLRHDDYSAETSDWSGGTFDCARAIRALALSEGHSASPVEDCSDQARNDRLFELDQPYDAETTDGWNPISTAPKDGPAFLVWVPENKCIYEVIARDSNLSIFGGGFRDNLWRATHWMPLPTPPSHPSTQSLRQEG